MISDNKNSNHQNSQKMPSSVENSVNVEIKSFVSNDLEEKVDEDSVSLNQTPETISSHSSINIMVSSSSSCGNVGSSSSSSLGHQENNQLKELTGPAVGSELSSSSRRSSISGDLDTKITRESKPGKSLRKPKRVNASKARKTRRLSRKKRELHNEDADDDESDNVFNESENDSALEKDIGAKSPKFNCLDLDLFDYLLKRNFLKSINHNQGNVKILNSTAKQRKLSLFTASSDFKDFENNLSINKYFYELIKNGKHLTNVRAREAGVKTIDLEVRGLMDELVSQVEKSVSQVPRKSLIKTLLQDMSSLNSISGMEDTIGNSGQTSGQTKRPDEPAEFEQHLDEVSTRDEKNFEQQNFEIQEEAKKVDINKEDKLRSMEKNSLNTKLNSCEKNLEKTMNELRSDHSSHLANTLTNAESSNGTVKKVILKSNEVVFIEDCVDDDDEEEKRLKLLKSSNKNAQNLINEMVAPVPRRQKADSMSKSQTFTLSKAAPKSGKDDDPYVKAALERFDAFCKSKSSHNLDQTGSGSATPTFVLNRQKSPYMTRKLSGSSQPAPQPDPAVKESVSSFIKRRSARVDPNKTDLTTRSASESRADTNKPFSSSSLAKKFLGSLSPQLDPADTAALLAEPDKAHDLVPDNSKTNSTCTSPTISDSNGSAHNSPPASPSHQSKPKLIKLEVLNSKTRPPKQPENKVTSSPATNKPPIPPSPTPQSARTKMCAKNGENDKKPAMPATQSAKPVSRIIPIEIKNSKNVTTKPNSVRTGTKSVERDVPSSTLDQSKNETLSSPSVQDRIRSFSTSYRDNDKNSQLHRDHGHAATAPAAVPHSDNIYESVMRQNAITDPKPDPIVEKACTNFMNKLKEYQRLQSTQYQSYSYTSPTSTYSGPIVSARNTNPSAEFACPSPPYKSLYTSVYSSPTMSSSYYEPASYAKLSCEADSSSARQPYVSAIRKRRTLFSDGFDSTSTELKGDNGTGYESEYSQCSARSESDENSQARHRPLSIVNEEANATVVRSHTINETRSKEVHDKAKLLKKSNSMTGPSKSEAKVRSTVFDRLSVNPTATSEAKACTKSSSSLSSKASYEIKKKEENEVAVVNSVVAKARRESTSSVTNGAPATANLSRLRSLDAKNRDKFKSTASLKQSARPTTHAAGSTAVPACYLYPCPDIKPAGILKSSSNTSTRSSEESRRKSHGTVKNSSESKKDVFERLSKKANSMKNLSKNLSKNSSSCSSSGEEPDHRALGDENDDNVFQTAYNSGTAKTSVFERLYKSNIAAHMSQDEVKNSSLKKNMSVSSANLISNGQSNQNSVKKSNLSKNKGFINTRVSLKNRKDDSGNDESNESKTSDSETIKNESPRDLTKSSFLCKKLVDLYDK